MLPLKLLKKSASCSNVIAMMKNIKELQHVAPTFQGSCHELNQPTSHCNAIQYWKHRFETEGVPEPVESIEHIIAHVIGKESEGLHEKEFDELQLQKLKMLCNRRLKKMPLEYCSSEEEYKNPKLNLAQKIFLPEQQTSILVDLLLKHITRSKSNICTVLEIGCGTGAIALSILRSCDTVEVTAIDTNVIACELIHHNAQNLELGSRLTILNATLLENGEIEITSNLSNDCKIDFENERFDFIVSCPPCIRKDELQKMQKGYEHIQCHNGGEDGLRIIRPLLKYASNHLNNDGVLLIEVLASQPKEIKLITEQQYSSTLKFDHTYESKCDNQRIVEITKIC